MSNSPRPGEKLRDKETGRIYTVVTRRPSASYNPEGIMFVKLRSEHMEQNVREDKIDIYFERVEERPVVGLGAFDEDLGKPVIRARRRR